MMDNQRHYVISEDTRLDVLKIIRTSKTGYSFNELFPLIQLLEGLPLMAPPVLDLDSQEVKPVEAKKVKNSDGKETKNVT